MAVMKPTTAANVVMIGAAALVGESVVHHHGEVAVMPRVAVAQDLNVVNQPEGPHNEIEMLAGPVKSTAEALPPSAEMPPFRRYAGDDVVMASWRRQQEQWHSFFASQTMPMMSPALWLTENSR
jgi:hypothetical protein